MRGIYLYKKITRHVENSLDNSCTENPLFVYNRHICIQTIPDGAPVRNLIIVEGAIQHGNQCR